MKTFLLDSNVARVVLPLLAALAGLDANCQTNSWTGPVSGYWEDANWSLGQLPGPGQTILFTNAGWKALAIGTNTTQSFPQTLTVDSVTVSSPGTDTVNTLLFNYAGLATPLTLDSLSVGTNCRAVMLYSALQVSSNLSVSGTFTQDVGSIISGTNAQLSLGDTASGSYSLQSGTLVMQTANVGTSAPSSFIQDGGTNDSDWVVVFGQSEFDLNGGMFDGGLVVNDAGIFRQTGGVAQLSAMGIDGNSFQSGGLLAGNGMEIPNQFMAGEFGANSHGTVVQTGGTNGQLSVQLGLPVGSVVLDRPGLPDDTGDYGLSNGVVATTNGTFIWGRGSMEQSGGTHTTYELLLSGTVHVTDFNTLGAIDWATYTLWDGMLTPQVINIDGAGSMTQFGGTNDVGSGLSLSATIEPFGTVTGSYLLEGGLLRTPSLVLSNASEFDQTGGQLVVSNLQMTGAGIQQTGGSMTQTGQFIMQGSAFRFGGGFQQLGQLMLGTLGGSNSFFTMPLAACVLQFADSSALTWSNQEDLTIVNWSGSLYGGGNQRMIFGNNSGALTAQQLAQITFQNPAGLPRTNYPARILSTGEIVPDSGTALPLRASLSNGASPGSIILSVGGEIGTTYEIEVSTNLLDWTFWTNSYDTEGLITFADSTANSPRRFYRARSVP